MRPWRKPLHDHPAVLEPPAVAALGRHGDVAVGAPVIESAGADELEARVGLRTAVG